MTTETPDYAALLTAALTEPGTLASCYNAMHRFSLGNRMLATMQLGTKIGPLATYPRWRELGRQVRKGEKAIALYMPVTCKAGSKGNDRTPQEQPDPTAECSPDAARTFTRFILRNNWFSVHQTDPIPGMEQTPEPLPADWDYTAALAKLGIDEIEYAMTDGNCQGYAVPSRKVIAINPLAAHPTRTRLHEIAHCLLHADGETWTDGQTLDRSAKEVEAEATAYLVSATLGLPGAEESRGYIQHWTQTATIPDATARRIMHAADTIITAGRQEQAS